MSLESKPGVYRLTFQHTNAIFIGGTSDVLGSAEHHISQASLYGVEARAEVLAYCDVDEIDDKTNEYIELARAFGMEVTADPGDSDYQMTLGPSDTTLDEPPVCFATQDGLSWFPLDTNQFRNRFGVQDPRAVNTALRKVWYKSHFIVKDEPSDEYPDPRLVNRNYNPILFRGEWWYKTAPLRRQLGMTQIQFASAIQSGLVGQEPIKQFAIFY